MAFTVTSFARPLPFSSFSTFRFHSSKSNIVCQSTSRQQHGLALLDLKNSFGTSRGGSALLERPDFDQSQFDPPYQVQEGGDIGRLSNRRGVGSGDSYRVLLIDDIRHTEKLVARVLPQVVPQVTPAAARRLFHESRENGVAVVIVTVKEHAEFYAQMMIRGGLRSRIEPAES